MRKGTNMLVLALILAVAVGIALGMLGGGGSILTTPILLYVLELPAHQAIPISLAVVGTTSVVALIPHARAKRVQWRAGALFGAASMVGAFLAGRVAGRIPSAVLVLMFGAMMLVTAVAMLRPRRPPRAMLQHETASETSSLPVLSLVVQGVGLGVVVGLVGAGGGFLVVPALVLLRGMPMEHAVATSLFVIAMNSVAALAGHLSRVSIDLGLTLELTLAAVSGSVVGLRLAKRVAPEQLRNVFGWFVVSMAIFVLGQEIPKAIGVHMTLARSWPWLLAGMLTPGLLAAWRHRQESSRFATRTP